MSNYSAGRVAHRWDRWIPWSFVLLFVVVAAVNAIFIAFAFLTSTGIETEQPFAEGLAYDQTLADARAQAARGWRSNLEVKSVTGQVRIEFQLADALGRALTGGDAQVQFTRPTQAALDFALTLREQSPGLYTAWAPLPEQGQWDVHVSIVRGADIYRSNERVVLR